MVGIGLVLALGFGVVACLAGLRRCVTFPVRLDVLSDPCEVLVLVEGLEGDAGLFDGEYPGFIWRWWGAPEGVQDLDGAVNVGALFRCLGDELEEVAQVELERSRTDLVSGLGLLLVFGAENRAAVSLLSLLDCFALRELGSGVPLELLEPLLLGGDEGVGLSVDLLAGLAAHGDCCRDCCRWGCVDSVLFGLGQGSLNAGGGDCQGVVRGERGRGHGRWCRAGGRCLCRTCGRLQSGFLERCGGAGYRGLLHWVCAVGLGCGTGEIGELDRECFVSGEHDAQHIGMEGRSGSWGQGTCHAAAEGVLV